MNLREGVKPFELDREEIQFRRSFENDRKPSNGAWDMTPSVWGKKNEKLGMFPAPHTEDFKSELHLAVSCRFRHV